MSGLILAIDTAFERCAVGLFDPAGDRLLAAAEPLIGKGHAERLMGLVETVLADAGRCYGDLGRLAVTVGPGSFTGLRVGIAAVRGLALSLSVPAVGVSTLEALAAPHQSTPNGGRVVLSVLDAKRGEVYAGLYGPETGTRGSGGVLGAPTALAPDALAAFVQTGLDRSGGGPSSRLSSNDLALVGTGAAIAAASLAAAWNSADGDGPVPITLTDEAHVDLLTLSRLAAAREADGPPLPLYLRGADAKPASAAAGLRFSAAERETIPQYRPA